MILDKGYATGYSAKRVCRRAEFSANAIASLSRSTGSTSVVVHGNSGVSCGFAALMAAAEDFNLVLLRKDNDNSHGSPIEGPQGHQLDRYIILDDFVATGNTMNRIRYKIATLYQQYSAPPAPECVGIVLYGHTISDRFKFSDGRVVPVRGRD